MPDEPTHKPRRRWDAAPITLAVIITGGYLATLVFVLTQAIPKESERVVDMMIGSLITQWGVAMAYFFGTTAGSSRKNEIIAKAGPVEHP